MVCPCATGTYLPYSHVPAHERDVLISHEAVDPFVHMAAYVTAISSPVPENHASRRSRNFALHLRTLGPVPIMKRPSELLSPPAAASIPRTDAA